MVMKATLVVTLVLSSIGRSALAQEDEGRRLSDGVPASRAPAGSVPSFQTSMAAAAGGDFLPFGQPARMNALGYAATTGGYDSTSRSGLFETIVEARVLGPLALRLGTSYSGESSKIRPSIGLRVGILDATRHGIDLSAGMLYRPEGFTETEGEIEGAIALGVRIQSLLMLGNLVYGQDPEGRERDGEARLALLAKLGQRVLLGLDGRARLNLASGGSGPRGEPHFDAVGGPVVNVIVGPLGFLLSGGGSAVQFDDASPTRYGLFVLGGLGLGL